MSQKQVKIAVVGVGNMGSQHAQHIIDLPNTALAAICDRNPARLEALDLPPALPRFTDYQTMLDAVELDAALIATPHYDHPDMCLAAFERGLHVLVEKPLAVHVQEAMRAIAGYQRAKRDRPDLVFAAMFNQRTFGHWRAIKALIDGGELGRLMRCTWIITDWFRTQHYYNSGDWRATWDGEGGGVLLNQCPHNLDLYQWLVGMPARLHGFAQFGKHHNIEVEDEVTAYFEHADGAVGHFITCTGESPGANRLEIVGELGTLVYEPVPTWAPDPADPDANDDEVASADDDIAEDCALDAADEASAADDIDITPADTETDITPADEGEDEEPPTDLVFYRNARSSADEIRLSTRGFVKAPFEREIVPYSTRADHGHEHIIENFADAILHGAELIARAEEGLNSVMLSNAILLSAHKRAMVALPIDGGEYAALLAQYIERPPGA